MDSDKIEKLNNSILDIEQSANSLKSYSKAYAEIEKLQDKISSNLSSSESISNELKDLIESFRIAIDDNSKQLKQIQELVESKIDELYKDNKSFQKELDSTLITRLDKSKSDIQVEIRDVESRLQSSVKSEINNSYKDLETKQTQQFDKQLNQIKIIKYFMVGVVVLSLATIVIGLLK
mgnify:CR=1 FL=1